MTHQDVVVIVHGRMLEKQVRVSLPLYPRDGKESRLLSFGVEVAVPNQASAAARALEADVVSRLAKFFPEAEAVHVPVRVSRSVQPDGDGRRAEAAGVRSRRRQSNSARCGRFYFWLNIGLNLPMLFLVESEDGGLRAEASVVAAQYYPERTVVAARFLKDVPNWIVKS